MAHLPGVLRGGTVGAGTLRPGTAPAPTNRDLYGSKTYMGPLGGQTASMVKHTLDDMGDKRTKRQDQVRAHAGHGGRMNVFAPKARGLTRVRQENTYSGLARASGKAPITTHLPVLGARERGGNKVRLTAQRHDLGLAAAQLRNNPLNHGFGGGMARPAIREKGSGGPLPEPA